MSGGRNRLARSIESEGSVGTGFLLSFLVGLSSQHVSEKVMVCLPSLGLLFGWLSLRLRFMSEVAGICDRRGNVRVDKC